MTAALPLSVEDARRLISEATDGAALSALAGEWRAVGDMPALLTLAKALWTDGGDADRIVAAKLLTKARMPDDGAVWAALCAWAESGAPRAAASALAAAGARRLTADLSRMDLIEGWATADAPALRAAAVGFALGLAKARHPAADIVAQRDRAAHWALGLSADPSPAPRRAAGEFLRALAKSDPQAQALLIEGKDALADPG